MNYSAIQVHFVTKSLNDECSLLPDSSLVYPYLYTIISFVGIITNLLSTINFVQMVLFIKLEGQMFKYLLVKSINDLIQFCFHIFSPVYYCGGCKKTYWSIVWYLGFYQYGEGIVEFSSSWMEVFATLEFYCLLTNKIKFIQKKSFFLTILIVTHIYAITYYTPVFVFLQLYETPLNGSSLNEKFEIEYSWGPSELLINYYYLFVILEGILNIQLHIIPFLLLLILSIILVVELRLAYNRKIKLLNNKQSKQNRINYKPIKSTAELALENQKNLIFCININFFIGHITKVIWFINILYFTDKVDSFKFWQCINKISLILMYISYTPNAFIFYKFNRHFRTYTHKILKSLFCESL
jgi:hypothetical protein